MKLKLVRSNDPRLTWYGAISLQKTTYGIMPWRLPYEHLDFFSQELIGKARMPAGVRIAFRSNTTSIGARFKVEIEKSNPKTTPDEASIDICCDGVLFQTIPLAEKNRFHLTGLPSKNKLTELWLPQSCSFKLQSLVLEKGATLLPFNDKRPRWITYGSSITQCRTATSPTQTWPAIVAQQRNFNLTCLGYGGQCHLDPMVARMMRDQPADLISLCLGINVYGDSSLNARTFRPAIIGFISILREKHPRTPLVVISPIYSPPRETKPNAVGFNLIRMREEVKTAIKIFKSHGDRNIHVINGLDLLGADCGHLLPDQLHPNPEGYRLMAQNFLKKTAKITNQLKQ